MNPAVSAPNRGLLLGIVGVYLAIFGIIIAAAVVIVGLSNGSCLAPGACTSTPSGSDQATGAVIAIVGLIVGAVFVVSAWGLFRRKAWSRRLVLIPLVILILPPLILPISDAVSGFGFFGAADLVAIIWALVNAFIAYLFLSDAGIKLALSQ